MAAKGIGSTSASSAAVTSTVSASHTAATTKTSTRTSSRSLASSREPAAVSSAAAAGHTDVYHSERYGMSSTSHSDYDRHLAPSRSSSVASSADYSGGYGADITATSSYQPRPFLARSLSSFYALDTSGPRSLHGMSAVSVTYHGHVAGSVSSTTPFSSGHSSGLYTTGGHTRHSSRRDEHDRQQMSTLHQSSGAASVVTRTGVYDTNRRYR